MATKTKFLAKGAKAPELQTKSGQDTAPAPPAADDPKGFKNYIAWSVACFLYPAQGGGTDEEQDISDNAKTNSDALALDINYYATKLAGQYGYTWTNVAPSAVGGLGTVGDMEKLVVSNLA